MATIKFKDTTTIEVPSVNASSIQTNGMSIDNYGNINITGTGKITGPITYKRDGTDAPLKIVYLSNEAYKDLTDIDDNTLYLCYS